MFARVRRFIFPAKRQFGERPPTEHDYADENDNVLLISWRQIDGARACAFAATSMMMLIGQSIGYKRIEPTLIYDNVA